MKPNENVDQLIETKLTKTEAIDLILEDMREEINNQRAELEKQIKAAEASITPADCVSLIKDMSVEVEVPRGRYYENYSITLRTGSTRNIGKFPVVLQSKLRHLSELKNKQELLGEKERELSDSKGKVRNAILKTMLEGSEQGQKFLQLLNGLRLKVSPKLMQAKKLLEQ